MKSCVRVNRRRALTLVELLVVLAIVAILAAFLFPVFGPAREKGRQAACAANLRQFGMALAMYHDTYGDYPRSMPSLISSLSDPRIARCPNAPARDPDGNEIPWSYGYRLEEALVYGIPSGTISAELIQSPNFVILYCPVHARVGRMMCLRANGAVHNLADSQIHRSIIRLGRPGPQVVWYRFPNEP